MLIDSLVQAGHSTAICFFAGWGMDTRPFDVWRHLALGCDLWICHSYHQSPESELEAFACLTGRYEKVAVIGWSFGVAVAWPLVFVTNESIASFTAVNGTPTPIHPQYGIDPRIMRRTVNRFGEIGRQLFYANICGGDATDFPVPERSTEDLGEELKYLEIRFTKTEHVKEIPSSLVSHMRACTSLLDRIIPTKHQTAAWARWQVPCHCVEGPHYNAPILLEILQQTASHVRSLTL